MEPSETSSTGDLTSRVACDTIPNLCVRNSLDMIDVCICWYGSIHVAFVVVRVGLRFEIRIHLIIFIFNRVRCIACRQVQCSVAGFSCRMWT